MKDPAVALAGRCEEASRMHYEAAMTEFRAFVLVSDKEALDNARLKLHAALDNMLDAYTNTHAAVKKALGL